jgi:hypothetical protein
VKHSKVGLPLAVVAAISLLVGVAFAAERAGVQLPDAMDVRGQNLVLNGLGVREATIFNVNVYVAGLYVRQHSSEPSDILKKDEPKALHMVFVREVSRDQMVEAWREGFEKNAGTRLASMQSRITQLDTWMADRKKGATLTFSYLPGQGVEVRVDGAVKGTLAGDDFAEVLFSIWLGPQPPNKGLKTGLLGRH